MSMTVPERDVPTAPPRSLSLTAIGWVAIVGGALVCPISLISVAMIAVGSPGTQTFDPVGFFWVVVAPPATLASGIGVVLRGRWAWVLMLTLLAAVLADNGHGIIQGPIPEVRTVSPGGVPTTVLASGPRYSIPALAIALGLVALLLSPKIRSEFFRPEPATEP